MLIELAYPFPQYSTKAFQGGCTGTQQAALEKFGKDGKATLKHPLSQQTEESPLKWPPMGMTGFN